MKIGGTEKITMKKCRCYDTGTLILKMRRNYEKHMKCRTGFPTDQKARSYIFTPVPVVSRIMMPNRNWFTEKIQAKLKPQKKKKKKSYRSVEDVIVLSVHSCVLLNKLCFVTFSLCHSSLAFSNAKLLPFFVPKSQN